MSKKEPLEERSMKKDYKKEAVWIEDGILAEHTNIIGFGVQRRDDEIHLEFYIREIRIDGQHIIHRDIEVLPDGNYDSGCLVDKEMIDKRLEELKKG